jgi:protein involved in polysaccharide export with SLBB domain
MMLGRSRLIRAFAAAVVLSVLALPSVEVGAQQASGDGVVPIRIQILGAVSRPGQVELSEGDRLSTALARAGAAAAVNSDLTRVYLVRIDAVTRKQVAYRINVLAALQRGDRIFDPILRQDDKIFVPQTSAPIFGHPRPLPGDWLHA